MTDQPSYHDLETRLKALETENAHLREANEKLRESEEKFKTIFETADDHIAYVGMDNRIIDVNHKFEDIFGHSREDVIGRKFNEFGVLSPEAWQRIMDYVGKMAGDGFVRSPVMEFEATGKDGKKVYLEVNPKAVVKDGKTVGYLSITRDITERKRAEEALRESEEKFKLIFESANDHIIYIGLDDRIIDINHRFEDVFGHTKEEVVGKRFYDVGILAYEDWQKFIDLARDLVAGKRPRTSVVGFEATGKDGRKVYLETNPKVVVKDGEPQGILCITRDVTARKREEEILRKHRDELERLVQERTSNFEEANAALRLMLQKAEEVKTEMEGTIRFNVKQFILPYLDRLKKTRLDDIQGTYLNSLEQSLNDVTLPFLPGSSTQYLKLTPTEIQVANLVKQGRTTKEIAEVLNMSLRTIDTHRYNIRSKLGLCNRQANLRTYLLSMQ